MPFRYSSDVSEPTQAEFIFPLPPLSAVVSFSARLGDTVLQGVVMSSDEAQVHRLAPCERQTTHLNPSKRPSRTLGAFLSPLAGALTFGVGTAGEV